MKKRTFKTKGSLIGITRNSLNYWERNKDRFSNNGSTPVVKVIMYPYDECGGYGQRRYCLILVNSDGERMYIGGCSAGFIGEGSRGTAQIIFDSRVFSHLSLEQVRNLVYHNRQFTITKAGDHVSFENSVPKRRIHYRERK